MTPERQAEIEVLGSLDNPVQNNDTAVFRFVCEAKRGIRELLAELATARQQAGDELEHITYPPAITAKCPHKCAGKHDCICDGLIPHAHHICKDTACACHQAEAYGLELAHDGHGREAYVRLHQRLTVPA